ncbi:hypothetical protein PP764_gp59 [Escherichia phage phi G17]|uniref:Uncharacterized protein n=1 Tax=Escherichia phage phi G17 TaxID=2234086 RepID=A0A2Z4Q0N8_9CAUD|nr:hypothetical protein PP764_gp59 [Escherichia phage phi G17]AWY03425.1 hypothetical protein [Escherichia phage phi G17]
MIITYPTHKMVEYMGSTVDVPLWVNYIALLPNTFTKSSTLIGFSHKPKLTDHGIWVSKKGKQEDIGLNTHYKPTKDSIYSTLEKV